MREIEFRGIRVENRDWVYGYYELSRKGNCKHHLIIHYTGDCRHVSEVLPETVGQFTGLRDSTRTEAFAEGQRVFEGDCFRIDGGVFVVTWDVYAARFYLKSTKSVLRKDVRYVREHTVLGSIHTQPDLMKG